MINKPRGTQDIYGDRVKYYDFVFNNFTKVAQLFGYQKIVTPIFENIETFIRSVGETSDIVKKEFYNFKDKSDREIALRPEGTAGVVRAVVEDKLIYTNPTPLKFYYYGPMFRYERPQSGRLREFNQFGIELIKSDSIYDDFDIIQFVVSTLKSVGISEYTIKINNLGGFEERSK
jgi:histidyl-tRNA synthetase